MNLTEATSQELDVMIKLIIRERAEVAVSLNEMDNLWGNNGEDYPGRKPKVELADTLEMWHTQFATAKMTKDKFERSMYS